MTDINTEYTSTRNRWRKWSRCNQNGCVEIDHRGSVVRVRDSKAGDKTPILSFGNAAWAAWLQEIRADVHGPARRKAASSTRAARRRAESILRVLFWVRRISCATRSAVGRRL